MRIAIISGSPRLSSITVRVAKHLQQALKSATDHHIDFIDLREDDMPAIQTVYNSVNAAPEEQHKEIAEKIFSANAFILVTPEYNGSYSPAMKNLLDHFPKQQHKAFGIVTASPGAMGGMRAAMQLQQLVPALFGILSPHMLLVPQVDKKFDEEGNLTEGSYEKNIRQFIMEFLWLAEKLVVEKVTL